MIKARVNNVDVEVPEGTKILFAARKPGFTLPHRRSHGNPSVQAVYDKFLEKSNSDKSHKLLHTHYFKRSTVDGKVLPETISQSRKN